MSDIRSAGLRPDGSRRRPGRLVTAAGILAAAFALGACGAGASSVPSVDLPTLDPNASPVAGCVDPATMAVIDQLTADGADIPAILSTNEDILVTGLRELQPADAATTAWRDDLVAAIEDGDMTTAQDKLTELASGGVTLEAC